MVACLNCLETVCGGIHRELQWLLCVVGVSGGFEVQPPCTLAEAIASETRPAAIPRQGSSADIVAEEDPAVRIVDQWYFVDQEVSTCTLLVVSEWKVVHFYMYLIRKLLLYVH